MQVNKKRLEIMRNAPVSKGLLMLGLPTMIGMLVGALYNVVDAFFVGRLGTSQMGAVAVVFPIVQIIIGLGMTFGSGAGSYISRLLGKNSFEKANQTASTALFSSLLCGIAFISITLLFLHPILQGLGATSTIMPYAKAYATIYIAGAIFNIFNVTMNNIVISEGAAKLTMTAMLISATLNAILDPIFIYSLGLGVQGAAIATVIAQSVSSSFYIVYIAKKKGTLRFSPTFFKLDKSIFAEILKIGIPTLLFQLLASISMGVTNNVASRFGDAAVAAFGIVIRILTIGMYLVFGYMKGFQPFAGYNYGAKQYKRLEQAIKLSLQWSGWFCGISALLLYSFAYPIVGVFCNNNPEVLSMGIKLLRANAILFAFFGYACLYANLFLALGMGKEGGMLSISRQGLFYFPAILLLPLAFGFNGVVYAQPLADVLTLALTFIFAQKIHKKLGFSTQSKEEQVLLYCPPEAIDKLCK